MIYIALAQSKAIFRRVSCCQIMSDQTTSSGNSKMKQMKQLAEDNICLHNKKPCHRSQTSIQYLSLKSHLLVWDKTGNRIPCTLRAWNSGMPPKQLRGFTLFLRNTRSPSSKLQLMYKFPPSPFRHREGWRAGKVSWPSL